MLLRSSSTPVLGSLLPSFSESPGHTTTIIHHEFPTCTAFKHPHNHPPRRPNKITSFQHHNYPMINFSCNSSPISPALVDKEGFRRARSDGNLQGLLSCDHSRASKTSKNIEANEDEWSDNDNIDVNVSSNSNLKKNAGNMLPGRHKNMILLRTIPSFSFYDSRGTRDDEDEDENQEDGNIGIEIINSMNSLVLTKEEEEDVRIGGNMYIDDSFENRYVEETCLANEHGGGCGDRNGGGGGGGGGFGRAKTGGSGKGDEYGVEEYYKRMVEENPNNPLFLRNYAQFLYQSRRELERAEEYFSRAILMDPNDGETLSQYAKLTLELHHDQERASSYFERAVQASPHDSHVHAAYASFLWEAEEEGEDEESNSPCTPPYFKESTHSNSVVNA